VAGGALAILFFFLRRRKNQTRKPTSARPTMGPITAPAIQALLEELGSLGGGGGVAVSDCWPSAGSVTIDVVAWRSVSIHESSVVANTDKM